jgi:hypothetical protein
MLGVDAGGGDVTALFLPYAAAAVRAEAARIEARRCVAAG